MVLIITQSRKYKAIVPIIQWFQEFRRWEEEELVDPGDIRVDDETILYVIAMVNVRPWCMTKYTELLVHWAKAYLRKINKSSWRWSYPDIECRIMF